MNWLSVPNGFPWSVAGLNPMACLALAHAPVVLGERDGLRGRVAVGPGELVELEPARGRPAREQAGRRGPGEGVGLGHVPGVARRPLDARVQPAVRLGDLGLGRRHVERGEAGVVAAVERDLDGLVQAQRERAGPGRAACTGARPTTAGRSRGRRGAAAARSRTPRRAPRPAGRGRSRRSGPRPWWRARGARRARGGRRRGGRAGAWGGAEGRPGGCISNRAGGPSDRTGGHPARVVIGASGAWWGALSRPPRPRARAIAYSVAPPNYVIVSPLASGY